MEEVQKLKYELGADNTQLKAAFTEATNVINKSVADASRAIDSLGIGFGALDQRARSLASGSMEKLDRAFDELGTSTSALATGGMKRLEAAIDALAIKANTAAVVVPKVDDATKKVSDTTEKAAVVTGRYGATVGVLNTRATMLASGGLRMMGVALAGVVGAAGATNLLQFVDKITTLDAQMKIATRSTADLSGVWQKLYQQAQRGGTALETQVDLFNRLARTARDLDASKLLQLTETVGLAAGLGGGGPGAEAAIMQLGQALASGKLAGDELNSVLEQTPRLAQAIADGMVKIGKVSGEQRVNLKKMAEDGKLDVDTLIKALLTQTEILQKEIDAMPRTMARAQQQISNSFLMVVKSITEAKSATGGVVTVMDELRTIIESPGFKSAMEGVFEVMARVAKFAAQELVNLKKDWDMIIGSVQAAIGWIDALAKKTNAAVQISEQGVSKVGERAAKMLADEEAKPRPNQDLIRNYRQIIEEQTSRLAAARQRQQAATPPRELYPPIDDENPYTSLPKLGTGRKPGSGGGGEDKDAKKRADGIKKVIEALKFEQEQLGRTNRERYIEEQLMVNGSKVTGQAAEDIRKRAGAIYDANKAQEIQNELLDIAAEQAAQQDKDREAAFERSEELKKAKAETISQITQEMEQNGQLVVALKKGNEEYEKLAIKLDLINRLRSAGGYLSEEDRTNVDKWTETIFEQNKELDKAKSKGNEFGMIMESAFEKAVAGGEKMKGMLKGLMQDIAKMIMRKTVTDPIGKGINGIFDNIGAGIGDWFTNLIGGAGSNGSWSTGQVIPLADGGHYSAGKARLVGERGPELEIPTQPGMIVSNDNLNKMLTGGGNAGNTYYIDASGADPAAIARLETVIRQVDASVEGRSRTATYSARTRGGAYRKAFK